MSERSDSSISDRLDGSSLDLSEDSSASDVDSDNSKDVNLNSKKFTDCNSFGAELEHKNNQNDECNINLTSETENTNSKSYSEPQEWTEVEKKIPELKLKNNSEFEDSIHLLENRINPIPLTATSTPKQKLEDSQILCNLFSFSMDGSSVEPENGSQTYVIAKSALNQSSSLSNEEVCKKFQDLSFAFKTDSMTIQKRLQMMKRKRDLAEFNIENELRIIKVKLKSLQYLDPNSEYVNLLTDLKKQLDFVLNATMQLSSSAESYGYAQHEERLLELVAVMLRHVENVESSKSESSKSSDKLKEESKRSPASVSLDSAGDDDRIFRRRSVAAVNLEGSSKRRASIAALPRIGHSALENGSNGKGSQWIFSRSAGNASKKFSFSQASPRTQTNNSSGTDESKRDSNGARNRRDSKTSEGSMKNIAEFPEQRSSLIEPELIEEPIDFDNNVEIYDSSLHLRQLFGSAEEIRRNSGAQEQITAADCLRRIIEWNKLIISSTRFRWPENVLHYVPFYVTWYVVLVLAFVFIGGLFTGINGCYTYSCVKYSALWFAVPAFFSFTRRFYHILLPLFFTLVLGMTLLFVWLTKFLLPQLSNEELDSLLKTFGLEIRYLNGPPPI